jgi:hypothetical protein
MHPDDVELKDNGCGTFPTIRLLNVPKSDAGRTLRNLVANRILDGDLPNLSLTHLSSREDRNTVFQFITEQVVSNEIHARAKHLCKGSWQDVLLLRGLLGFGILGISLSFQLFW